MAGLFHFFLASDAARRLGGDWQAGARNVHPAVNALAVAAVVVGGCFHPAHVAAAPCCAWVLRACPLGVFAHNPVHAIPSQRPSTRPLRAGVVCVDVGGCRRVTGRASPGHGVDLLGCGGLQAGGSRRGRGRLGEEPHAGVPAVRYGRWGTPGDGWASVAYLASHRRTRSARGVGTGCDLPCSAAPSAWATDAHLVLSN